MTVNIAHTKIEVVKDTEDHISLEYDGNIIVVINNGKFCIEKDFRDKYGFPNPDINCAFDRDNNPFFCCDYLYVCIHDGNLFDPIKKRYKIEFTSDDSDYSPLKIEYKNSSLKVTDMCYPDDLTDVHVVEEEYCKEEKVLYDSDYYYVYSQYFDSRCSDRQSPHLFNNKEKAVKFFQNELLKLISKENKMVILPGYFNNKYDYYGFYTSCSLKVLLIENVYLEEE